MTFCDRRLPASSPSGLSVHVCVVRVYDESSNVARWRTVLTDEERARADRFVFEKDRLSYTITRAILRTLLGRYLDVLPERLTITTDRFGKPTVPPPQHDGRLMFNVSHSSDFALLAFAATRVGVDIEKIRPNDAVADLAKAVFTPYEWNAFLRLPDGDRLRAFFQAWARKEAFVKGLGEGLSIPPETVEAHRATPGWCIQDLDIHGDYAAAVAAQSPAAELHVWHW